MVTAYPLQQIVPTVSVDPVTGIAVPGGSVPNPLPIDGGNPNPVKVTPDPTACFGIQNCPGTCLETELCATVVIPPAVPPSLGGILLRGAAVVAGDVTITVPVGVIWELRGLSISVITPVGVTAFGSMEVFSVVSGVDMLLGSLFFTGFAPASNVASAAATTATLKDLTLSPGDAIKLRVTFYGGVGVPIGYAGVAYSSFTALTPYASYYAKARR